MRVLLGELGMRSVIFVVIAALIFCGCLSQYAFAGVEGLSFATAKKPVIFIEVPSAGPYVPCELR